MRGRKRGSAEDEFDGGVVHPPEVAGAERRQGLAGAAVLRLAGVEAVGIGFGDDRRDGARDGEGVFGHAVHDVGHPLAAAGFVAEYLPVAGRGALVHLGDEVVDGGAD
ncbi:MAG: hypothetical protein ACKOQ9_09315, partial [Verrucomicrobiota bacterium]